MLLFSGLSRYGSEIAAEQIANFDRHTRHVHRMMSLVNEATAILGGPNRDISEIGEFGKTLPTPRMVFVGEPSNMTVVDAHKGPVRWRVELTGRAAHSSMPQYGVNAIAYAARLMGEILRMEEELKAGPLNPRAADFPGPRSSRSPRRTFRV